MSFSFLAIDNSTYPSLPAPAAETFSLVAADIVAFPRLFPYSLTAFKAGLAANSPGYNMGDPKIKTAAQAIIQGGLVGGGYSISTAATRASVIVKQSCVTELVIAIITDAGA